MAVVIAIGVNASGQREVLGLDVGPSEDGAFWHAFLRSLVSRGLSGVKLVTSDAHERLIDARIRATTAQVAVHPHRDRCRVWGRIRLEQRYRSERLPWLTVAALDDVAARPRVPDRVDYRPRSSLALISSDAAYRGTDRRSRIGC